MFLLLSVPVCGDALPGFGQVRDRAAKVSAGLGALNPRGNRGVTHDCRWLRESPSLVTTGQFIVTLCGGCCPPSKPSPGAAAEKLIPFGRTASSRAAFLLKPSGLAKNLWSQCEANDFILGAAST